MPMSFNIFSRRHRKQFDEAFHRDFVAPPLTEISFYTEMPIDKTNGKALTEFKVVGRPTIALWTKGDVLWLWPRPDPSKRWRLFIQEDTRP